MNILSELKALEQNHNIRILFAGESDSRAWGFPSPDSDYDVRFIYLRPLEWYLSLNQLKDTQNIKRATARTDYRLCESGLVYILQTFKFSDLRLADR